MKIFDSAIRLLSSRLITNISGFVVLAVSAQVLGAATLGSYVLFLSVFNILAMAGDIGIQEGLTKRLSESENPNDNDSILSSAAVMLSAAVLAISVIIAVAAPMINGYLGFQGSFYLIMMIAIDAFYKTIVRTLQGEKRVDVSANLKIIQPLFSRSLAIVLVFNGYGIEGLIFGSYIGRIAATLWGIRLINTSLGPPRIPVMKSLMNYSKYSVVTTMGGRIFSWADTLIIGLLMTQSHVAIYEVAWQITQVFAFLPASLMSTVFPKISQLSSEDDITNVSSIVNRVSYLPLVFIIPGIFGGYILREELLSVFFGADFTPAATVLIILLIGKVIQSYHITVGRTLSAMDLPHLAMRSRLISIPANVILNFLLIPILGINGAAIASVASMSINLTTNYHYLIDYFNIEIPWVKVGWMLFSSCCMFGAVSLAKGQLVMSGYVSLLTLVLLGALVYIGLLTFSREIRTALKEFVRMEIS